jgi:hypothetical protein
MKNSIWILALIGVAVLLLKKKDSAPEATATSTNVTNPALYEKVAGYTPTQLETFTTNAQKYGSAAPVGYGYDAERNVYQFIGQGTPVNGNWTLPVN